MNIAIDLRSLNNLQFSGVENYIQNVVHGLLRLDKKNKYVLYSNSFRKSSLDDFRFINSKIRLTRFPNKLVNLGIKTKMLSMEKLIGDFDVLFMPNPGPVHLKSKARLVVTAHDLSPVTVPEFYDLKRRFWHRFINLKKVFERADVILAVSAYTKQDLVRVFNIPEAKIEVVHLGVDSKTYNPFLPDSELRRVRNLYGLPGDYILFLNTIEPRKNLAGLVKAFELYSGDEFLLIAGKLGWKYKEVLKIISASRKKSKIRYLGYVKEKHKPAIIKMSKALMYPSFYEGFGLQALEAASMGTPSLVSKVTSLPEIMKDSSLLVNPYSTSEIARGIDAVCNDLPLRKRLVEKGLQNAKNYSWDATVNKTFQALIQG